MLTGIQRSRTATLLVSPLQPGFPLHGGCRLLLQSPDLLSVLILAKPSFATMGIFLQALERNEALCLPAFDDQMALLFPILQQNLEEFPKQPPLFSTSSSLPSLLTEILAWRQNCPWWSLRCVSQTVLPTTAWSSPSAVWECADILSQNSY